MQKDSYEDILFLEHPTSLRHPRMSVQNRAAQFAPFAALTGYEEALGETARQTSQRIALDEDSKENLDRKLQWLLAHKEEQIKVQITYFIEDTKKEGGRYVTEKENISRLLTYEEKIVLGSGKQIKTTDIMDLQWEHCDIF